MIEHLDDDSRNQYLGYYVEWEASYDSYSRSDSALTASLSEKSIGLSLSLVSDMTEIVQKIEKKERVKFCGVIMKVYFDFIFLDYVEILGLSARQ